MKSQKLKIFFDDKPLGGSHAVRGIGSYTRNIVEALKDQKEIQLVDGVRGADIVHYPYFDFFFNTLQLVGKPTVVTIYDTIPLIYPRHYQTGIKGRVNLVKQKKKLKKVDAIITISETSKKDIIRFLDVPAEKVHAVYLAPSKAFKNIRDLKKLREIKEKYNLPDKFVLFVGDINYNKNVINLVKACRASKLPLIISGKQAVEVEQLLTLRKLGGPRDWLRYTFGFPHPEHAHLEELLNEFKSNPNVKRLGFVSEEDLVVIYNLATVYCQPSYYEGFGLPVLEAMASGCPVVSSLTQTLVEIAEGAALFVDANDYKEIANCLTRVVKNDSIRKDLISKGLKHSKNFSWDKTAKETSKIYQKVVKL